MLPIANRPMMEHIISCSSSTGSTRSSSPWRSSPTTSRRTSATAREFGVSMTYADEPVPLGTAGSVGNARDAARRDVPRDLRRRAHRHRPRPRCSQFHRDKASSPRSASPPVDNPLEFGIVITRDDGSIERFLEKPTWGQVFSDTINTGIYVLEPEIFDFIPEGRSVDFSSEVFPALLAAGRPMYGARRRRLLGGRRHARGVPVGAQGRARPARWSSSMPGFRVNEASGSARAPRSRPTRRSSARRSSDPAARSRPAATSASTRVLGSNVRLLGEAARRALRAARQRLRRATDAGCAARSSGAAAASATTSASTRASCSATRSFVGNDALDQRRRQGLPVQDDRGRRDRQQQHRVGEQGRAQPVRPRRRQRPRQRRRDARARGARRDGLRHVVAEGHHGRHLARLQPSGADAEAGDDGRAQRGRHRRARPRGRERAGDPVPGPLAARVRRADRAARTTTTSTASIVRFFDDSRHRHHRGRAAQDRAAVPARGHPPRAGRGDRRHHSSRTARSRSTRSRSRRPSSRPRSATSASSWSSTTPTARPAP